MYCAVVLDVFSRGVVGWSIDSRPQAQSSYALGVAIENRQPNGSIIQCDHGQFTSWAFTQPALDSGLTLSVDSIGDCYDCDVMPGSPGRV